MEIKNVIEILKDIENSEYSPTKEIIIVAININKSNVNVFWRYEDEEEINEVTL